MMRSIRWLLFFWLAAPSIVRGDQTWEKLRPFFTPPAQYAKPSDSYPSLLRFDDGRPVKTPADWAQRRLEILNKWHQVMGPWPKLIDHPALKVVETKDREGITQKRIRVQVSATQTLAGYLLLPPGQGKHPAVLVVFYDPETSVGLNPERGKNLDFAWQLAKRGFVTLSIGSPGGDAWRPDRDGAMCQPLSYLAYIAANCANLLGDLPEVDPSRIGVTGHSYGGKWAMVASCLCDKFAAAAWSDPGIVFDEKRPNVNYWEPWYLGLDPTLKTQRKPGLPTPQDPRTGAYRIMIDRHMDLHELHALMAPRPFFISGGSEDTPARWPALMRTIEVNALLAQKDRVGMQNRPNHSPTEESNAYLYAFFEHFLR